MGIPPLYWVYGNPVNQNPEMQVIAGSESRFPGIADYLSFGDCLPFGYMDAAEMAVKGAKALTVIDHH